MQRLKRGDRAITSCYIALLRGVNVGRAKRVVMGDLRDCLEELGYMNVRTLLNSGNVVFDAAGTSVRAHVDSIRGALMATLDLDVRIVAKPARELTAIMSNNPLLDRVTDPARRLVAFVNEPSALTRLGPLVSGDWAPEVLAVGRHAAYLWCPNGVSKGQLAAAVGRQLSESVTTRNWSTVVKLHAMLG